MTATGTCSAPKQQPPAYTQSDILVLLLTSCPLPSNVLPKHLIEELYLTEPADPIAAMIDILERNPELGAALAAKQQ